MKNYNQFYSRYINNLNIISGYTPSYPLKGISPLGQGKIKLADDGTFNCSATKTKGDPEKFIRLLFPTFTKQGALEAIKIESDEQFDLDPNVIQSKLLRFRTSIPEVAGLSHKTGISTKTLINLPVWVNQSGSRISMVQYNQNKQPINLTQWEYGDRAEETIGVPRVDFAPDAERIWFAENMLDAASLQLRLNEPVYIRPNFKTLKYNDFESITENKQVILIIQNERDDWEFSFFPFIKKLKQWNRNFHVIYTNPLTCGFTVNSWLKNDKNLTYFLQAKAEDSGQNVVAYDRETYHEFITINHYKIMNAPQDVQNDMFWYKINNGEFVHSWPLNVCTADELLKKHRIKTDGSEDPEIRLTKDEVLNISVSIKQNTPRMVYERIKEFILRYIYFQHHETASLLAIWVMGSYVHRLFPAYAYLHRIGNIDTGKTSNLELMAMTAFNGILESQTTKAKVVEQVNRLGCTLCLDEFEPSSLGAGDEYSQMLKGGYNKSGSYSKISGKGNVSRFSTYSPKMLGSSHDIVDHGLKSRTIPIRTISIPDDKTIDIWDVTDDNIQKTARNIRLGCYTMGLYHHRSIQQLVNQIDSTIELPSGEKLSTRRRQIVAPLLAIARLIDTNGKANTEAELLKALEIAWFEPVKQQIKLEKMLIDVLQKWDQDLPKTAFKSSHGITWFDNALWDGTPLFSQFDNRNSLLSWLYTFAGVKKGSVYIPIVKTKSCTGFPHDLKINKSTFRTLFRR